MPLGADTPSAMIGAHLASSVATRLRWPTAFVQALVVAGVAAGISSTFLAQLAAVVFAFEVVLGGFGGIVFVVPTLIAVGVAGFVTYELVGTPATYPVPLPAIHWDATLLLYLAPAILAGLAAIAYVTLLQRSKPLWARVRLPPMGRMVVAGALVGLVAIWLPEVLGTGTATMKDLFGGATMPLATLLVLAAAETILTPDALALVREHDEPMVVDRDHPARDHGARGLNVVGGRRRRRHRRPGPHASARGPSPDPEACSRRHGAR
jgi:CIC family chloride channel protein